MSEYWTWKQEMYAFCKFCGRKHNIFLQDSNTNIHSNINKIRNDSAILLTAFLIITDKETVNEIQQTKPIILSYFLQSPPEIVILSIASDRKGSIWIQTRM